MRLIIYKYPIPAICILLLIGIVLLVSLHIVPNPLDRWTGNMEERLGVRCTAEARQCPDGTYVTRTGTQCAFALCKDANRVTDLTATSSTLSSSSIPVVPPRPPKPPAKPLAPPTGVACTMDAKQCPDGSYVGRSGPKCEFSPCPIESGTNGVITVSGTVSIGPTCPVEKNPPDAACANKPYTGTIILTNTSDGKTYSARTDEHGVFTLSLMRGVYDVSRPANESPFPVCRGKIEITSAAAVIPISCDSGIR